MRITFDKNVLADYGRASGDKPSSPYGFQIDGQRVVQVDDGPGWEHLQMRDRKNRVITLSFTSEREHKTYGEASMFAIELNDLPTIGEFIIQGVKGAGTVARSCKSAALQSVKSTQNGVRTINTFAFLLGELKISKV